MRLVAPLTLFAVCSCVAASKRGLGWYDEQANALLTTSHSPISWIYNWSPTAPKTKKKVEFVAMQWGSAGIDNLDKEIPKGTKYLLAFNEPDGSSQSNLTPQQAAALWPKLEAMAKKHNLKLSSPATIQRDYTWMDEFFKACRHCKVDFITQHWYGTSIDDFKSMIRTTHSKYKRPIWVTEFAMIQSSPSATLSFLKTAMAFLDSVSYVERYAWFGLVLNNGGFVGNNAGLVTEAGKLTELGKAYVYYRN
ncbi:hypothetical protein BZG36_05368 [Bifiguratus adelaidae]|uniref:Asl1-like glycosyl hydrolase catalytic domain-containing protein n=1 Tax=Bifiguratus adelaidae TaxID=1938954 RepID=A0A261XTL2_9FUNG|nr:hypothetical protein BZG36_05368 [Bifiguratus adelaidae]